MESPFVVTEAPCRASNVYAYQRHPRCLVYFEKSLKQFLAWDEVWVDERIRGQGFATLRDVQACLDGGDSATPREPDRVFYLVDVRKRTISTTTLAEFKSRRHVSESSSSSSSSALLSPLEASVASLVVMPVLHPPSSSTVSALSSSDHHSAVTRVSVSPSPAEPRSIFKNTEPIHQIYKPDAARKERINRYDQEQEAFLCRNWVPADLADTKTTKMHPVGACYVVLSYIQRILRWPLEETRVVVQYDTNAVPLSSIIGKVYERYHIESHLPTSDATTRLLVWCLASLNAFGIIRPLVFKGTSENAYRLSELCASRNTYERRLYYITWPFRVDSQQVWVLKNRTKLHPVPLKNTFLSDLHWEKNVTRTLREIPPWVYALCGRP